MGRYDYDDDDDDDDGDDSRVPCLLFVLEFTIRTTPNLQFHSLNDIILSLDQLYRQKMTINSK